ncbi:MAG: hypothetical protein WAO00_11665 [Chthoniobacterales bacterium]
MDGIQQTLKRNLRGNAGKANVKRNGKYQNVQQRGDRMQGGYSTNLTWLSPVIVADPKMPWARMQRFIRRHV